MGSFFDKIKAFEIQKGTIFRVQFPLFLKPRSFLLGKEGIYLQLECE